MTITVPDHDALVAHIKTHVQMLVHKEGWPAIAEACGEYGISQATLRNLYLWEAGDDRSFNLKKLIAAYDFAWDRLNEYKVRGS